MNQTKNTTNKGSLLIIGMLFILTLMSCKKLIEVDGPKTAVNSENIYNQDATASSVLAGVYSKMSAANLQGDGLTSISFLGGISADELTINSSAPNIAAYYSNTLDSKIAGREFWNTIYSNLYILNAAIEGLSKSTSLTPSVKQQLLGEAKFTRAFSFFYLVNLYGDIPLTTTTDYRVNALMPRISKVEIWNKIIEDLKDAKTMLSSTYLDGTLKNQTSERVRPTKWAAIALLSRSYLYMKDWKNAEEEASNVLNNEEGLFTLVALDQAFRKNNKEAIWQLQPVFSGSNSQDANLFIINFASDLPIKPAISPSLLDKFEIGDQRRTNWISSIELDGVTYNFAYKYKIQRTGLATDPVDEYATVLRLSEQYLIRAEARIQQDKIADGINDLNVIRSRATDKTADPALQLKVLPTDLLKDQAILAVERERQVELFTEWGHRWLDIKRTNRVDAIMSSELPKKLNGGLWKSYQQWYPIPLEQLQLNPNLVQTSGY